MRQAPASFLHRILLGSVLVVASSSCSRKHEGPEVGDSVTNWLRSCTDDGECRGTATCIHALCSIPCSERAADSCAPLSRDAVCDQGESFCDLPCQSSAACSALGADFICSAGRCRTKPQSEPAPSTASGATEGSSPPAPVSAALLDDDLQLTQGEPRAQHFEVMGTTQRLFDAQVTFVLDQLSPRIGGQAASWQGDHWLVLWRVHLDTIESPFQFDRVRIYPAGRYELERIVLPYDNLRSPLAIHGEDGRLAFVSGERGGGRPCSIAVADIPKGISYAPSDFLCMDSGLVELTASAVPDSDDWLLTWRVEQLVDDSRQPFRVARYNPLLPSWSAGPWEMLAENFSIPGIRAGSVSHYVFSVPANPKGFLYRFVVGPEVPALVPVVNALPPASAEIRNTVTLANGIMLLTWNGGEQQPSVSVVSNDGRLDGPFALDPLRHGEFEALYLPEREQVALCFTRPEVAVLMLDERARQVGSPVVIAPGSPSTQCDLAWSGSELLVTWNFSENDAISARVIPSDELPR